MLLMILLLMMATMMMMMMTMMMMIFANANITLFTHVDSWFLCGHSFGLFLNASRHTTCYCIESMEYFCRWCQPGTNQQYIIEEGLLSSLIIWYWNSPPPIQGWHYEAWSSRLLQVREGLVCAVMFMVQSGHPRRKPSKGLAGKMGLYDMSPL